MIDKKMPLTSGSKAEKTANSKPSTVKGTSTKQQASISKLAIVALIVAIAGTSGLFVWQQQQSQIFSQQIQQESDLQLQQYQRENEHALQQQKIIFSQQFDEVVKQLNNTSKVNDLKDKRIFELDQAVQQLGKSIQQRQPSDWLLHETEYLIRIAARTLWLEHDTKAAVGLLQDADARLTELDDPAYLPVRELIHQDIKSLELMPKLQTDEIVLALMAMNKQVTTLPLAIVNLGVDEAGDKNLELSDDLSDWQSNLAKTWQKFIDDFIRVSQRSGVIEPLMSPEQQQHLKQNLSLKIQLALWAATERKSDIYQKALTDIQQWFIDFFDMQHPDNQHFVKALSTLKQQRVSYDYPSELSSLVAIRAALTKKFLKLVLPAETEVQHANNEKTNEQADEHTPSQLNNEGEL